MKLNKAVKSIILISTFGLLSLSLTDCTKMITPEQLTQLQDLRKREISLNDEISKTKNEISKLEQELKSRQADAKNCNDKKEFVEKKLSQWPNVWPE